MGVNWSNPLLAQVCWTRPLWRRGALTLASQLRQGEGQRRLGEALEIREIDPEEYVLSDKEPHVTYHVSVWFWPWWHIQGRQGKNYGRVLHHVMVGPRSKATFRLTYEEVLRRKLMQYGSLSKSSPSSWCSF